MEDTTNIVTCFNLFYRHDWNGLVIGHSSCNILTPNTIYFVRMCVYLHMSLRHFIFYIFKNDFRIYNDDCIIKLIINYKF